MKKLIKILFVSTIIILSINLIGCTSENNNNTNYLDQEGINCFDITNQNECSNNNECFWMNFEEYNESYCLDLECHHFYEKNDCDNNELNCYWNTESSEEYCTQLHCYSYLSEETCQTSNLECQWENFDLCQEKRYCLELKSEGDCLQNPDLMCKWHKSEWDENYGECYELECWDYLSEGECNEQESLNCQWINETCHENTCYNFNSKEECVNQESLECEWNQEYQECYQLYCLAYQSKDECIENEGLDCEWVNYQQCSKTYY